MQIRQLFDAPIDTVPLTVVDVETTGLSARNGDRVCEIAAVRFQGDVELARFVTLVNPCRRISPGALAVHRLDETILQTAPTFDEIAPTLHAFLDGNVLVAHNAPFDLGFLGAEFSRAGLRPPSVTVIDTLEIARRWFAFPSNSLSAIARALGIPGGVHRALADVLTTHAVLRHFLKLLGSGRPIRLGDLLDLQGVALDWPRISFLRSTVPPPFATFLASRQRLRLRYRSGTGELTEREIDPIEVIDEAGVQKLVAYCHLRQEFRTFRLDRIVAWEAI